MAEWISPNSFSDPNSRWADEPKAYDDSTGTFASDGGNSGYFVELYTPYPVRCTKVRVFSIRFIPPSSFASASVDIDLYYNGQWNHLFDGNLGSYWQWREIALTSEQIVTAMRIRHTGGNYFWLYEFDFYGESAGVRALAGGGLTNGGLTEKGLV